jgi:ferrochelatase
MQAHEAKYGVLLVQMGGAQDLEGVASFIFEMLKDRRIIDLPFFLRLPLAFFVSRLRAPKVRKQYAQIGGRSPIIEATFEQGRALSCTLKGQGFNCPVEVGFRYCSPRIEDAMERLASFGVKTIVFLPLYPQYSTTTTLSALDVAMKTAKRLGVALEVIEDYADNPDFIEAWVENIRRSFSVIQDKDNILLCFSAHGIPVKYVTRGDPYPARVQKTVEGVLARVNGLEGITASVLCYQSRFGKMKFLEPGILEALEEGRRKGAKRVLVVPISFVSDHLETLFELDKTVRKRALALGYDDFVVVKPLGVSQRFINALSGLVIGRISKEDEDG